MRLSDFIEDGTENRIIGGRWLEVTKLKASIERIKEKIKGKEPLTENQVVGIIDDEMGEALI